MERPCQDNEGLCKGNCLRLCHVPVLQGDEMKCPHCLENFHVGNTTSPGDIDVSAHGVYEFHNTCFIDEDGDIDFWIEKVICPACDKFIITLVSELHSGEHRDLIWPKAPSRSPVPPEVPEEFAADYREACLVLADSPKASAALSRRCLQHILREITGVKPGNLYNEIEEATALKGFSSSLEELLDVPRKVGNNAAHPLKNPATGSIVDVEPWEAEWCLEVIEALYDHYFVAPAKNAERLSRLGQKMSP